MNKEKSKWIIIRIKRETAERLKDTATYDLIINELIKKTANKRETKIDSEVDFFPKDDNPNHNLITEDEAIE